jgi:hypothetical protein
MINWFKTLWCRKTGKHWYKPTFFLTEPVQKTSKRLKPRDGKKCRLCKHSIVLVPISGHYKDRNNGIWIPLDPLTKKEVLQNGFKL